MLVVLEVARDAHHKWQTPLFQCSGSLDPGMSGFRLGYGSASDLEVVLVGIVVPPASGVLDEIQLDESVSETNPSTGTW